MNYLTSRNTFRLLLIPVFCFFFSILVAGCGGGGDSAGDNVGDNVGDNNDELPTHSEMLAALGVDTDIGARVGETGEWVSDDYNPMSKKITQLAKRSEIFLAGTQGQSESAGWTPGDLVHVALDWPDGTDTTDFVSDNMPGGDSWLKLPKAMGSGDLDGDGIDEIFVAYLKNSTQAGYDKELAFKVIKKVNGYSTIEGTVASYTNAEITEYPTNYWYMNNFNVVCGDVDGNGESETLIAFNGSIFLIGDDSKDYAVNNRKDYVKSGDTTILLLKVSAGDLDSNGTDEFVVVENRIKHDAQYGLAVYHIYTGMNLDELVTDNVEMVVDASEITLHSSNCAVGDLDADGLNEVLFVGAPEGTHVWNFGLFEVDYYMMILEPVWNENTGGFIFKFTYYNLLYGRDYDFLTPICAIADFDGDGKKEILAYRHIFQNLSENPEPFTVLVDDIYSAPGGLGLGSVWDCSLAVGDLDGNMKADISYISDGFQELNSLGFNESNEWVRRGTGDIINSGQYYPYVVMGDFDGDSIAVEFLESETLFSDPHPIAVLAANPFWSGVDMDGETSFGMTNDDAVLKEESIGLSVGFTVGAGFEIPLVAGASVKTTFESSFDWTAAKSVTIEQSYAYDTVNEDMVVFTVIPYDVYYYEVIQSPDPGNVGEVITVNLPRDPLTLPAELSYYNANNGEGLDIDGAVLTHTIGDPFSYPTSGEAEDLIAFGGGQGLISSNMLTVGPGTGSTSIGMSLTEANTDGFAFDFSVKIESEVSAGGAIAGASAGFHYGESYAITSSTGTLYGGKVGLIPTDKYDPSMGFSWGLFSYRASLGSEEFVVVQYYTE